MDKIKKIINMSDKEFITYVKKNKITIEGIEFDTENVTIFKNALILKYQEEYLNSEVSKKTKQLKAKLEQQKVALDAAQEALDELTGEDDENDETDENGLTPVEKNAKLIEAEAAKQTEIINSLKTEAERKAYITALGNTMGAAMSDEVDSVFANFVTLADTQPSTDLPTSEIITNLSIRLIDQTISNLSVTYPLMNLVVTKVVANGIKEIFYKDYRDSDNVSGYDDVTIADFNQGREPVFSEAYQVNKNIHKGWDVLSSLLNDVTLSLGLFVALIKDYTMAIGRPFAKVMFQRFITFLDTPAVYDEVLTFKGTTAKDKAKEFYKKIVTLSAPSRTHLKKSIRGTTKGLETSIPQTQLHVILNVDYAADYKYDLTANTFQLGEITIKVASITVVDFKTITPEYSTEAAHTLDKTEVILFQYGAYNEMIMFSAAKTMNTPKLKTVIHRYDRIGNYRAKDKLIIKYEKA